jgi:hypothetical protein
MNNIYSTYEEYLENIDNDISEYLKKYDGTTEEDFYKELKERYELFDFEKRTVKVQLIHPNEGLIQTNANVYDYKHVLSNAFRYYEYINKKEIDVNGLPDDYYQVIENSDCSERLVGESDILLNKKDLQVLSLIYDFEIVNRVHGREYYPSFNLNLFQNLEQTYKLIFAGRQIDSESETQNEIDDAIESALGDKDEPISYGRFFVIENKTGKQLLSDVTGKTDLNQKQVLVLGRLIKDKMFRFAPPTDTRLALGLDVLFNFSHKNIRGKLNLNKSAKELKINLSDKEKAELKLLLEKMINDLNVKY